MKARTLIVMLWLIMGACAQVRQIEGGTKDETAPFLIGSDPPQLSTNFKGQRIVLEFNERIQLDRVKDRMIVSPPLAEAPDVRITGAKNVTIDLKAPLEDNTTYTFGIGEAVKDLTEGNPAAGLNFVISTGDVLDSLRFEGVVVNANSGTPEKDVLVSLYRDMDTTDIRTGKPSYASRTDAQGHFAMAHLRPGKYRLYALRDQNANYKYDLPNEEVAFLDAPIELIPGDTSVLPPTLRLFLATSPVQALREARVQPDGALRMVIARPAQELQLRDIARTGGDLEWQFEWSTGRDTIQAWPSDTTTLALGHYEVRCDTTILDTVRYRTVERMPFNTGVRVAVKESGAEAIAELLAARPIARIDTALVRIERDSLVLPFSMEPDAGSPRIVRIRTAMEPGGSATLLLLPKALTDIYGGYNDSLRTGLGRAAEKSTGTLRISLEERIARTDPVIVQLLDAQRRVVQEAILAVNENSVVWERLRPGEHLLRLIIDRNGNGRWDTGDLDQGIQPEPVLPHDEGINVRAAWDLGVVLQFK
jgi:uncharacterized protein (DUF2141 family)